MTAELPVARLDLPDAMTAPPARRVMAALRDAGADARFVGGCVRDALLGRPLRDIDIATDAVPEAVLRLLAAAGIKSVPTGIEHGTVTAVCDHQPFEITTLRRDVQTFGRRAVVAFSKDWREDAARRDFTMNALSLASDGSLFDYFGGVADARAGRVRFVGDPEQRIREDVLRLLRFFRFLAHYGRGTPDRDGMDACTRLAPLLPTLSGERVRAELLRLLEAPDPVPVWRLILEGGIAPHLLPQAIRIDRLAGLVRIGPPDPVLRLAALLEGGRETALEVAERLRLSNAERDRLLALLDPPVAVDPAGPGPALRRAAYRLGADRARDLILLAAAGQGLAGDALGPALEAVTAAVPAALPVAGRDVVARGVRPGPEVGRLLAELEAWWEERDYRPDREALLRELDARLGNRG